MGDNYSLTLPTYIDDFFRKKSKLPCCNDRQFLKNSNGYHRAEITKNYYEKKESSLLNAFVDQPDFARRDQELCSSKYFLLNPFSSVITLPVCVNVIGWADDKLPKKPLPRSLKSTKLNQPKDDHPAKKKGFLPFPDQPSHSSKHSDFGNCSKSHRSHKNENLTIYKQHDTNRSKSPHRMDYSSLSKKHLSLDPQPCTSTHSDGKDSRFPRKKTHIQLHKPLPKGKRSVGSATSSSTILTLLSELSRSNSGLKFRHKQHTREFSSSAYWSHKERKDQSTQCYNYVEDVMIKSNWFNTTDVDDFLSKKVPSHNSLKVVKDDSLEGEARLSKTRASLFLILKKELLQALLSSNSFELTADDSYPVKAFEQIDYLPPTTKDSVELCGKATYTLLPAEKPIELSTKSTYTILSRREPIKVYDKATYSSLPIKTPRKKSEKATYTLPEDSIEKFEKATHTTEMCERSTYTISPIKKMGKMYEKATLTLLPEEKSTETFDKSTYTVPLDIESVDRATYILPSAVVSTEIFVRTTCTLSGDTLHSISDYSDSMQLLDDSQKELVAETAKKLMLGSLGNKPLLQEPNGKIYESATSIANSSSVKDLVKDLFSKPSDELLDIELPASTSTNVTAKTQEENSGMLSDSKQSLYNDGVPQQMPKNLPIMVEKVTTESFIKKLQQVIEVKLSEVIDIKCKRLLDEVKNFNNKTSSDLHSRICCQQAQLFNKLLELDKEPLFLKARLEQLHDIFLKNAGIPLQAHKSNQTIPSEPSTPEIYSKADMWNKSFEQLIESKLKKALLDKSRKLSDLLPEFSSDLTASQTDINMTYKKKQQKAFSKPIRVFQNLFKRPGKKPSTESICKQTQCSSLSVSKEVASQQSTESLFEEDEEDMYETKLYTSQKALTILKKLLSKTFKERSKSEVRQASEQTDSPPMLSEKQSAQSMIKSPPKQLNSPLKTFLTASLKDLPYLSEEQSQQDRQSELSLKMVGDVPSTAMFKQKSTQAFIEELQKKLSYRFFTPLNKPLLLFEEEELQKERHPKCKNHQNCKTWRLCKREEVPDDLLNKMSQMPLTAIVKLHEQQSSDQNPQMSFKTLVEDLYKNMQQDELSHKVTESQECIVHALKKLIKKDTVEDEAVQKSDNLDTVAEKSTTTEKKVETRDVRASTSEGFVSMTHTLKDEELQMNTNSRGSNASQTSACKMDRTESSSTLKSYQKENQKSNQTVDRNAALTSDNEINQNFNQASLEKKRDSSISFGKANKQVSIKQSSLSIKKDSEKSISSRGNIDSRLYYRELKEENDDNEINQNFSKTSLEKKRDSSISFSKLNKQEMIKQSLLSTKKDSDRSTSSKGNIGSLLFYGELKEENDDNEINQNFSQKSLGKKRDSSISFGKANKQVNRKQSLLSTKKDSERSISSRGNIDSRLYYGELKEENDDNEINQNFSKTSLEKKRDSSISFSKLNKQEMIKQSLLSTKKGSERSTSSKENIGSRLFYEELKEDNDDNELNQNFSQKSLEKKRDSSISFGKANKQVNRKQSLLSTKKDSERSISSRENIGTRLFYGALKEENDDNEINKSVSKISLEKKRDSSISFGKANKQVSIKQSLLSTKKDYERSTSSKENIDSRLFDDELKEENGDNEINQNFSKTSLEKKRDSSISFGKANKQVSIKQSLPSTKEDYERSTSSKENIDSRLFDDELKEENDDNEINQNFSKTSLEKKRDSSISFSKLNKQEMIKQSLLSTKKDYERSISSRENIGSRLFYGELKEENDDNEINQNFSKTSLEKKRDSSISFGKANKQEIIRQNSLSTKKESKRSTPSKENIDSRSFYGELKQKNDENTKRTGHRENLSITSPKEKTVNSESNSEVNKKEKSSSGKNATSKESTRSKEIMEMWSSYDDENVERIIDYEEIEKVSITSSDAKSDNSSLKKSNKKDDRKPSSAKKRTDSRLSPDESNKKVDKSVGSIKGYEDDENISITSSTKGRADDSDSNDEVNEKRRSSSRRKSTKRESRKSTLSRERTDSWLSYDDAVKKMSADVGPTRYYEENENVSITSSVQGGSDNSDTNDEINEKSSSRRRSTKRESRKSTSANEKSGWPFNDESIKKIDEKVGNESPDSMDNVSKKRASLSHRRSSRRESRKSKSEKENTGWPFNDESIKKIDENVGNDTSDSMHDLRKKRKSLSHRRSKQKVNVNVALTSENENVSMTSANGRTDNSGSNSEINIKQKSSSGKRSTKKEYAESNSKRRSSYDKSNQKIERKLGSEDELSASFDIASVGGKTDSFVSASEIEKRGRKRRKSMKKGKKDLEKPTSSKAKSVSSLSPDSSVSVEEIKEKVHRKKNISDDKVHKKRSEKAKTAFFEENRESSSSESAASRKMDKMKELTLDDEKTVSSAEATSKTHTQGKSLAHSKKGVNNLEVDENSSRILKEKQGFSSLVSCNCAEKTTNVLEQLREALTDKELFEKLLNFYEREEKIVERLSNDEEFIKSQLELIRKKRAGGKDTSTKESFASTSGLAKIQEEDEERELRTVPKISQEEKKLNAAAFPDEKDGPARREERSLSVVGKGASPSAVSVTKSPSKTKSGFRSKVTRLFGYGNSEQMKEIVAPREERRDSIDEKVADPAGEDNQKVKFSRGADPFEEEKKMFSISNTSLLRPHFAKAERRPSQDSNDSNIIKPSDLGKHFLRGFRTDHVALDGETCLFITKSERERRQRPHLYKEAMIEFSERDSPLEYLLALGFSIDEASNAIKDEDVKNRLFAAITEARIWVNQISTVQGTLLYLVAYKTKPKTMRYFLQLVEAIINQRINNAVKLNSFLRVLEKVEDGDLTMIHVLGSEKFEDEENEEKVIKKQLRQLFIDVYKIAEFEAALKGITVSREGTVLLRIMAAKYRAGLHPHLELIARYIGQGLIKTEVQLEAAMIYLSRLDTADVNLKEFEQYCAIRCKQDQKQGAKK